MIADNLERVRARIAAACRAAGRDVESVTLLVVSKRFGPDAVRAAATADARCFGENHVQEAIEKIEALDDLSGALACAELVLGRDRGNEQAQRCADNCQRRLLNLYSSKIGGMKSVLRRAMDDMELRWLGLDHRSAFLLSRVDGVASVEEVLDVCGMPRLEALKTLVDLLDRGAIRVK